jgi:F0F1-type ATP synthase membrane subunit c/vacuolar-type H+-ATPase subunit K
MTADEYRAALKALGLTQVGAGKMMGVSARTAQEYAAKGPSGPAAFAVRLLLAMPDDARAKWLAEA